MLKLKQATLCIYGFDFVSSRRDSDSNYDGRFDRRCHHWSEHFIKPPNVEKLMEYMSSPERKKEYEELERNIRESMQPKPWWYTRRIGTRA